MIYNERQTTSDTSRCYKEMGAVTAGKQGINICYTENRVKKVNSNQSSSVCDLWSGMMLEVVGIHCLGNPSFHYSQSVFVKLHW